MSPGLEENPENLTSILSQVKQLKEVITDKDFDEYHQHCDIFISPDLRGVGMLSFDAESVARVTQSGYDAAQAQEANFQALKQMLNSQSAHHTPASSSKKKAINIIHDKVKISEIELIGIDKSVERWMRRACTVRVGDLISKEAWV